MNEKEGRRPILVGAQDPLPEDHFWFEGKGFSIYAADQPRSAWVEHTHDCAQITIGLEPARISAEWRTPAKSSARRELSGNAVSIIPPGEPHRTLWQRRASLVHVYIQTDFLLETAQKVLRSELILLRPAYLVRDPLIEELGRALFSECGRSHLSDVFATSFATVLTTHLLRNYAADGETASDLLGGLGPARERRVREYIEQFLERDLSIDSLSKVAGLSPQYFASVFRQATGFTPHQYVSHRRIERAQQLLSDPRLSLTDIGSLCGFANQSQFTTLFKRFAGVTPGRFRTL